VVVASLTLRVLGLEEEATASRLEADELRHRWNDLEDRHKALARTVLDAVRVMRPEGHLLPNRLRSLPCQVRDVVALCVRQVLPVRWPQCAFGLVGIWPGWSPGSL
jgi:hypothetical protein